MSSERVELALERISEDSSLTGDLDDQTASVLLQWAQQQVKAADALTDDAAFGERVVAIRSAARTAARPTTRSGAPDPANVFVQRATELLNASLRQTTAPTLAALEPAKAENTDADAPSDERADVPVAAVRATQFAEAAAPSITTTARTPWQMLRRRLRRWIHRKA